MPEQPHDPRPPILVVDDNHDNTDIIRHYLEVRGYPISVAHDGDEALALFEQTRPSVVLLDVMMPGRDGWEVCRLMKEHPEHGKIVRIVMVTALDEFGDKQQALQTGADDYVEKPFDLSRLATTVERNVALVPSFVRPVPGAPGAPSASGASSASAP